MYTYLLHSFDIGSLPLPLIGPNCSSPLSFSLWSSSQSKTVLQTIVLSVIFDSVIPAASMYSFIANVHYLTYFSYGLAWIFLRKNYDSSNYRNLVCYILLMKNNEPERCHLCLLVSEISVYVFFFSELRLLSITSSMCFESNISPRVLLLNTLQQIVVKKYVIFDLAS